MYSEAIQKHLTQTGTYVGYADFNFSKGKTHATQVLLTKAKTEIEEALKLIKEVTGE